MKNLAKYRMVHETPSHFIMHDGKAHFHVAKEGLTPELSSKIQQLAKGGKVQKLAEGGKVYPEGTSENVKNNFTPEEVQQHAEARARHQAQQAKAVQQEEPSSADKIGTNMERAAKPQQLAEGGPILNPEGVSSLAQAFGNKKAHGGEIQKFSGEDVPPSAQEVQPANVDQAPISLDINSSPNDPLYGNSTQLPVPTEVPPQQQISMSSQPAHSPVQAPAVSQANVNPMIKGPQSLDEAQQMENKGVMQVANAQSKAAADTAKSLQEYQQAEIARQKLVTDHMDQLDKENGELFKQVTTDKIDSNRVWHNMSTGGKIVAALGLILGGAGSGITGGPNMAQGYLEKTISNDIEAQKADQSNKMSAYKMGLERYRDAQSASTFAALQAQTMVAAKLQQIAATSNDPTIQGKAKQQIAEIYTKMAPLKVELAQRALALDLTGGNGTGKVNVEGLAPEYRERAVALPNGRIALAPTKEDATQVKKSLTHFDNIEAQLKTMLNFQKEHGRALGSWTVNSADGESMRDNVILELNQLHDLNRLNEREFDSYKHMVPSPGDWLQDRATAKMMRLIKIIQGHRQDEYANHLTNAVVPQINTAPPVLTGQPVSNKQLKKMGK